MADAPLSVLEAAFLEAVRPTPAGRPPRMPAPAHACLNAAVIVYQDQRVWYPCRSHKGGVHRFLARPDACPAPWCRLPAGHRELHDIPPGTVEIHDAIGAVKQRG